MAVCGSCDARDGERIRSRERSRTGVARVCGDVGSVAGWPSGRDRSDGKKIWDQQLNDACKAAEEIVVAANVDAQEIIRAAATDAELSRSSPSSETDGSGQAPTSEVVFSPETRAAAEEWVAKQKALAEQAQRPKKKGIISQSNHAPLSARSTERRSAA